MQIRLGYDIGLNVRAPITIVAMLHVHPSRNTELLQPDEMHPDPSVRVTSHTENFGIANLTHSNVDSDGVASEVTAGFNR